MSSMIKKKIIRYHNNHRYKSGKDKGDGHKTKN